MKSQSKIFISFCISCKCFAFSCSTSYTGRLAWFCNIVMETEGRNTKCRFVELLQSPKKKPDHMPTECQAQVADCTNSRKPSLQDLKQTKTKPKKNNCTNPKYQSPSKVAEVDLITLCSLLQCEKRCYQIQKLFKLLAEERILFLRSAQIIFIIICKNGQKGILW